MTARWPIFLSGLLVAGCISNAAYSNAPLLTNYQKDAMQDGGSSKMSQNEQLQPCHQSFDNTVFIEADFIYWNVGQEGNTYGAVTIGDSPNGPVALGAANNNGPGQIYRPPSKMSPGFKVALGMNINKDLWDAVLRYTWMHSHSHGSTPFNYYFQNLFEVNSDQNTFTIQGGAADSKIHFNSLDGEFGKNMYLSSSFSLRRFIGLKGLWSKESLDVSYYPSPDDPSVLDGSVLQSTYVQHYWGLGPRVGASGLWALYKNYLGVFAEGAFSALWSQFNLKATDYSTYKYNAAWWSNTTNNSSGVVPADVSDAVGLYQQYKIHTLIPAFELSLGLQTDWVFDNGSRFLASAAWETQMFLFMVQHSSTIADLNLNMQGFTLKLRYDF